MRYRAHGPKKLILEEHICLVLTPCLVPRLRYRACAWKYEPILPCVASLNRDKIITLCL